MMLPVVLLTVGLVWLFGCSKSGKELEVPVREIASSELIGTWKRPDGGYILRVREARPDGGAEVAYFNPRPIQVSAAKWRMVGKVLKLEVAFDDQNYRGSTYTLVYNAETDQLEGIYYQAVAQQSFEVFFVRRPEGDGA